MLAYHNVITLVKCNYIDLYIYIYIYIYIQYIYIYIYIHMKMYMCLTNVYKSLANIHTQRHIYTCFNTISTAAGELNNYIIKNKYIIT